MPTLVEHVVQRDDHRLGVERVEDRLDEKQIHATIEQTARLLHVGVPQRIERDCPSGRVVHIGRN